MCTFEDVDPGRLPVSGRGSALPPPGSAVEPPNFRRRGAPCCWRLLSVMQRLTPGSLLARGHLAVHSGWHAKGMRMLESGYITARSLACTPTTGYDRLRYRQSLVTESVALASFHVKHIEMARRKPISRAQIKLLKPLATSSGHHSCRWSPCPTLWPLRRAKADYGPLRQDGNRADPWLNREPHLAYTRHSKHLRPSAGGLVGASAESRPRTRTEA